MTDPRLAAWAVAFAMSVGGCASMSATPPTSATASASTTATNTPSLSLEDQKLVDSKARVVLLWQTIDKLLTDPTSSMNQLDPLVGGDALTSLQLMITRTGQAGEVQVGKTVVTDQSAVASGDTWIVNSCIDRSGATFVKSGQPVSASPSPRLSHQDTLAIIGGYLKVTEDKVVGPC